MPARPSSSLLRERTISTHRSPSLISQETGKGKSEPPAVTSAQVYPSVRRVGLWSAVLATTFSITYDVGRLAEWFGLLGSHGGPESASTPHSRDRSRHMGGDDRWVLPGRLQLQAASINACEHAPTMPLPAAELRQSFQQFPEQGHLEAAQSITCLHFISSEVWLSRHALQGWAPAAL
jgi:hypothetical protein